METGNQCGSYCDRVEGDRSSLAWGGHCGDGDRGELGDISSSRSIRSTWGARKRVDFDPFQDEAHVPHFAKSFP